MLCSCGGRASAVFVQIAGTAWSVHKAGGQGLASDTREAIATEGRSEVERVLNGDEPPRMIGCTTYGCNRPSV